MFAYTRTADEFVLDRDFPFRNINIGVSFERYSSSILKLPERTPTDITLAQVLIASCLLNEQLYLFLYRYDLIYMGEISTG